MASRATLPQLPTTPLQLLIDAALAPSTDAESRALALHFSLSCINATAIPAPTLQSVTELNGGISFLEHAALKEAEQSWQQLIEFCATGNATELVDRLKLAKLPLFGPIEKSLAQWRGGPRSQEYFQAATQVLANPNAYAIQFDKWLSKDLDRQLVGKYGLSRNQSIYVRDAIYNNFVTSNNNHAFHLTERCALFAVCPSSTVLNDAETHQAQRIADQMRQAIEQQRWDLLIPLQ